MTERARNVTALVIVVCAIAVWGWFRADTSYSDVEPILPVVAGAIGLWLWNPWKRRSGL